MAEKQTDRPSPKVLAQVLRNRRGATGRDAAARMHNRRPLQPSAEYVAAANQAVGQTAQPMAGMALGGGYDPLPVDPRAAAFRRDAQTVEYSGAGAPGMVYANVNGAPTLMPLATARQRGLQIISSDVARQLGERAEAQSAFSGAQASGGVVPLPGHAAGAVVPDPLTLAAMLRSGR